MNATVSFVILVFHTPTRQKKRLKAAVQSWPSIVIDNTEMNRGYAGGMNIGIRQALASKSEWIVLANDDITASEDSIRRFIKSLQRYDSGIIGIVPGYVDRHRWTTTLLNSGNDRMRIDYVSGAFWAIHRSVIKSIGLLDERYFLYYEDVDYCIRAKKTGFSVECIDVPDIVHMREEKIGGALKKEQYYLARNHLLFVQQQAPLMVKLRELIRMPKTVYEHYVQKEYMAIEGICDFALQRFGMYKRSI